MGTITKLYTLDATEAHALGDLIQTAHAVLGPLDGGRLLPAGCRLLYRAQSQPAPLEEYREALLSLGAEFTALPACDATIAKARGAIRSLLPHEG